MIEELRRAIGQLARRRRAPLTMIAVLALTGGVTAAALDVIAAFLWRPLPYPSSDRLVVADYPRQNGPSPRDLQAIAGTAVSEFAELAVASDPDSFTVLGADTPFTIDGRWTSGDVFTMFGVVPALGRGFTREEAARGERLAVIGHHVWQERFGGRADVIGRSITVRATIRQREPETYTIAGVLPPRFWHVEERTSLILPLRPPRLPWLMRLRVGVSGDEAAARLTAIVRSQAPRLAPEWSVVVRSARDAHVERVRPMLAITAWGVLLIAGIAVANLAFLQMARGVQRQRESAVRAVLGASRRALARQILVESFVTGAIAAWLAVSFAFVLTRTGAIAVEQYFGRVIPAGGLGQDPALWLLVPFATIAASMLLGMILFAVSTGAPLASALAGTASMTDTPWRLAVRQSIVAAQIAVAFTLLVGAGLMIRTAWHLGRLDLGFNPAGVLSANLTLHEGTYRSLDDRREFFRTLTARLLELPEVEAAGLTGWLPFRIGPSVTIEIEGAAQPAPVASMQGVSPEYFTALQMRLREGRFLDDGDRAGRDNAAVISESLARLAWGDASPLGRQFRIKFSPEPGRGFGPYTIVGVAGDVRQSVMNSTPPQVYLSFYQQPLATNAFLQIRTRRAPMDAVAPLARVVRDINPELALGSVTTIDAIIAAEGLRPRLLARALVAFALLAIAIAAIGLFAVSAWIAQLRQREAAVRVALGGGRASVTALLARRGLIAIGAGLLLGWIAAVPVSLAIASELRGVAASDASTRAIVALLLTAVSVVALLRPAWRASRGNLAALLREE